MGSSFAVLPSSHCSPVSTTPLPQSGVVPGADREVTAGRFVVGVTPHTPNVAVDFGESEFCEPIVTWPGVIVTLPPHVLLGVVPLRSITVFHWVLVRPTLVTVPERQYPPGQLLMS